MEVICESVLSGASTTDTFDIAFKDQGIVSPINPCGQDSISFQSTIADIAYTISYPANNLFVSIAVNQVNQQCPIQCSITDSATGAALPSPPFTTYGTTGSFSIFTSDSNYDGISYGVTATCQSIYSAQGPISQQFTI